MRLNKYFLLLMLPAVPALAADTLDCKLQRRDAGILLQSPIVDGQAETQTKGSNELSLGLDATLDTRSYFLVLQDDIRSQRLAFSGSPLGATPEGNSLELGESKASCLRTLEGESQPIQPTIVRPDYLACVLDDVKFVMGSPTDSKRLLANSTATPRNGEPHVVKGENAAASYEVKYTGFDFLQGLQITVTDKASGQTARFVGPANSMATAFMLGFSQGDRSIDANLLRLGCIYTDDANPFEIK